MTRTRLFTLILSAGLLASTAACARIPMRAAEAAPAVRKEFAYHEAADADPVRHRLDLYLPEGKQGFPVILFIHGGAWRAGSKDLYGRFAQTFVDRGIGVAVANYRLSPAVQHPEHVRDVARSFAWTVKHAREHGADPGRVYVMGHSAGAHLVALLALDPRYLKAEGLTSRSIRGVIGVSGPYALGSKGFENVFGEDEAKRRDAFPLHHVADLDAKEIPPFLIQMAESDYAGLPLAARALAEALQAKGVKVRREEIADRDHITIISRMTQADDPAVKQIVEFVAP